MNVLDTIFRIFMFLVPYAISFALYIWVGKKVLQMQNKVAKVIAMIVFIPGFLYAIYRLATSISSILTNDLFNFQIILYAIGNLFFVAIIMAIGEPEKSK